MSFEILFPVHWILLLISLILAIIVISLKKGRIYRLITYGFIGAAIACGIAFMLKEYFSSEEFVTWSAFLTGFGILIGAMLSISFYLNARVDSLNARIDSLNTRVKDLNINLNARIDSINERIDKLLNRAKKSEDEEK